VRRLGDAAVVLEGLLRRDGRSLEEALPLAQRIDPSLTRVAATTLAAGRTCVVMNYLL
jgi:hypothetical protein